MDNNSFTLPMRDNNINSVFSNNTAKSYQKDICLYLAKKLNAVGIDNDNIAIIFNNTSRITEVRVSPFATILISNEFYENKFFNDEIVEAHRHIAVGIAHSKLEELITLQEQFLENFTEDGFPSSKSSWIHLEILESADNPIYASVNKDLKAFIIHLAFSYSYNKNDFEEDNKILVKGVNLKEKESDYSMFIELNQ